MQPEIARDQREWGAALSITSIGLQTGMANREGERVLLGDHSLQLQHQPPGTTSGSVTRMPRSSQEKHSTDQQNRQSAE